MDRRDPAPAGSTDGRRSDGFRRRFSGLSRPSGVRHIARARLVAAVVLGLGMLALAFAGGSRGLAGLRAWIYGQDAYQLSFDEIELKPSPPPWILPGARGILDSVRRDGHWDRPISLLDPDEPEKLARSFALDSPWIEEVVRVEQGFPRKLTVELRYREPVAYVDWVDPPAKFVIDGEAHLLPLVELDRAAAGPLPRIMTKFRQGATIRDLPRPLERTPGSAWESSPDPADRPTSTVSGGRPTISPQLASARMAAFLRAHRAEDEPLVSQIKAIYPPDQERGIYLATEDRTIILWGDPPGLEPAGSHDAEAKWRFLKAWVAREGTLHIPTDASGNAVDYLGFGRRGVFRASEVEGPAAPRG